MIRKYNDSDFNEVNKLTEASWKEELNLSSELQKLIYSFLTKYSILNKEFSFVDYSTKVDAFVFAGHKNDTNDSIKWFYDNLNVLSDDDKKQAIEYMNYLEYNHNKVIKYMNDNDIYLSLIASGKRNSGRKLLDYLYDVAKKNNSNIYLWTDETCNYKYYEKNNFNLIEDYYITLQDKKIKTFIYKK